MTVCGSHVQVDTNTYCAHAPIHAFLAYSSKAAYNRVFNFFFFGGGGGGGRFQVELVHSAVQVDHNDSYKILGGASPGLWFN